MVRLVRGVISTGAALILGFAIPPLSTASASSPTVRLASTVLVPGSQVGVGGIGFPAGTQVQLQLCGHKAIDGSADCAPDALLLSATGGLGEIDGFMLVELPPKPCPCVVLVLTLPNIFSTSIPVTVVPARIATGPLASVPQLTVQANVTGGMSLASLFGLRAHRTLALTIKNTGTVDAFPVISAGWGRSASNLSSISAPKISPLAPGQATRVNIPFTMGPLSVGSYVVGGTVAGAVRPVGFQVKTSTIPWGLFAIGLLLLQAVLILLRNRVRGRLDRKDATSGQAGPDGTGGPARKPAAPPAPSGASTDGDAGVPSADSQPGEVPDRLDLARVQSLPEPVVGSISRAAAQSVLKAVCEQADGVAIPANGTSEVIKEKPGGE
jgi:hypothetical protein